MTAAIAVTQPKALTLADVQSKFAAWRDKKENSRSAIPEELWSAAVMLCTDNSVHKISRGLRLNHTDLKKKVVSGGSSLTCSAMPVAQDFVAIDIPRMDDGAAVLIEMAHRNGNRMRMQLKGNGQMKRHLR